MNRPSHTLPRLCWFVCGNRVVALRPFDRRRRPRARRPAAKEATIRVRAAERAKEAIPKYITGKFCEHLGTNIYNGMDAQILRNPTFAEFPFSAGQHARRPGGVPNRPRADRPPNAAAGQADRLAGGARSTGSSRPARTRWPAGGFAPAAGRRCKSVPTPARTAAARSACKCAKAGEGIAQWTCLPLHRVRKYEFEILARSPDRCVAYGVTVRQRLGKAAGHCRRQAAHARVDHAPRHAGTRCQAAGRRRLSLGHHGRRAGAVRYPARAAASGRSRRRGRSRRGAAAQGVAVAALALAGRELRLRVSLGRRRRPDRRAAHAAELRLGRHRDAISSARPSSSPSAARWAASR